MAVYRHPKPMEFRSKSDIVSAYIREMIITGDLAPGSALRQRDLAQQFGVSPTPVREALRRLETEGLVHSDLHRGATVVEGVVGPSEENNWVRANLEPFAARLAALRITDEEIDRLETIHVEIVRLAADEAVDGRYNELNRRFHFAIYEAARSPLLLALLRLLWQAFPLGPRTVRPLSDSIARHTAILAALRSRNPAAAEQHTRAHILESVGYSEDDLRPAGGAMLDSISAATAADAR